VHNVLLTPVVWDGGRELSTPGITAVVVVYDGAPPPRWQSVVDETLRTGLVLTAAQRSEAISLRLRATVRVLDEIF
jgi:hypothetical protein